MLAELTKRDKKIARQIIEQGMMNEFMNGLAEVEKKLSEGRDGDQSPQVRWHQLYHTTVSFDKHISRRYDDLRGSRYLLTIGVQLVDGVISEDSLEELSEPVRERLIAFKNSMYEEYA